MCLSFHQILIFIFQTNKSILEVDDLVEPLVVSRFVIDHALKESGKYLVALEVFLLIFELNLSRLKSLLKIVDGFSFSLDLFFLFGELLLLRLSLERVKLELGCLIRHFIDHLLLFFLV
jgi:hypothetical protein